MASPRACGWVEDAWELFWQFIPAAWFDMNHGPDPPWVQRVFQAIWTMHKVDLAGLQHAYAG